jgi:hypothetical protein
MALRVNQKIEDFNPHPGKLKSNFGSAFSALSARPLKVVIDCLPVTDALSLFSTCKEYNPLLKDKRLWKRLLIRDFGQESILQDVSYETAYKINIDIVKRVIHSPCAYFHDIPGVKCFHFIRAMNEKINVGRRDARIRKFLTSSENRIEAERSVNSIKNAKNEKCGFLRLISSSYLDAHNFAEAERVAMLITTPEEKSKALLDLATSYITERTLAERLELISRAEETALLISDPEKMSEVLVLISRSYNQGCLRTQAERAAMLIPIPHRKSVVLLDIIREYRGPWMADVERWFAEAEEAALLISDPEKKSNALCQIVQEVRKADKLAGRLLVAAEKAALLISDPEKMRWQLLRIANLRNYCGFGKKTPVIGLL